MRHDTDQKKPATPPPAETGKAPSDLVTGSILFIIFIIFMVVWMTTYPDS